MVSTASRPTTSGNSASVAFSESAAGELVEQGAALAADGVAGDWRAELARHLQGAENRVIVDAENDVDGRSRAKRLPGLPHGFLEDAAAVDPMRDEPAGKGLCETGQEPFDPLAGVGKRFQGDEQAVQRSTTGRRAPLPARIPSSREAA